MLGFAWLALRQAQEALDRGRLEEAQRLLGQNCLQGHKRGPVNLAVRPQQAEFSKLEVPKGL